MHGAQPLQTAARLELESALRVDLVSSASLLLLLWPSPNASGSESWSWNCLRFETENRTGSYISKTKPQVFGPLEMKCMDIGLELGFRPSVGVALRRQILLL